MDQVLTKPKNIKERNAAKALARSKRNSPPRSTHVSPRKTRRKMVLGMRSIKESAAKLGETSKITTDHVQQLSAELLREKTVAELREMCKERDLKFTTKLTKPVLIDLLVHS